MTPYSTAPLCALPAALPMAQARRVLVIAPHPDDETIGCGGAIALLRKAGVPVRVVLVSDGSGAGELPMGTAAARQHEFRAALQVLGVDDCVLLGLPDGRLAEVSDLAERILAQVVDYAPNWAFGPSLQDIHRDHRAVATALRAAVGHVGGACWLFEYETWSASAVDYVLDIGAVLDTKLSALRQHRTALACGPYLRAAEGLAHYRGLLLGRPDGGVAEAFRCAIELGVTDDMVDSKADVPSIRARADSLPGAGAPPGPDCQQAKSSRLSRLATAQLRVAGETDAWTTTLGRALRDTWMAFPIAESTRRRVRSWLSGSTWAGPMLRWLALSDPMADVHRTDTVTAEAETTNGTMAKRGTNQT